jgi:CRISPR-associated endonuclease/helicase Cas3
MTYKARYRTGSNTEYQGLSTHLTETAMYVELFAKKIGLSKSALLTALVHDMGKACQPWQGYLEDNNKNGKTENKEVHATAGGQYLYNCIAKEKSKATELIGVILSACVMYHHGQGLPDVIKPDGSPKLYDRLKKATIETHVDEVVAKLRYIFSV